MTASDSPDTMRLNSRAIAEDLRAMQEALRQVRSLILEGAGSTAFTDKHDGSPVTDTDIAVEKAIQAFMMRRFPDTPVFGEETGYDDGLPGAFWLIDPIDGTKAFIKNIPTYTSMAVLIQDGEAVAAAIYNPSTNVMYTAQKGVGAYKDGVRIDLQSIPLPPVAICKEQLIDELNTMLAPKGVSCEKAPIGGGFGFTMVLDGLAAARFNLLGGGYTHDYAPGALLVREAGGALVPIKDDVYTYETRSFVACHPELEAVIRPHLPRLRELELARK